MPSQGGFGVTLQRKASQPGVRIALPSACSHRAARFQARDRSVSCQHNRSELPRLRRLHGKGRWRQMKDVARIRLRDGRIRLAELHRYEAHGIGKKEFKHKRYLE
jgi:hypothetical protein